MLFIFVIVLIFFLQLLDMLEFVPSHAAVCSVLAWFLLASIAVCFLIAFTPYDFVNSFVGRV